MSSNLNTYKFPFKKKMLMGTKLKFSKFLFFGKNVDGTKLKFQKLVLGPCAYNFYTLLVSLELLVYVYHILCPLTSYSLYPKLRINNMSS